MRMAFLLHLFFIASFFIPRDAHSMEIYQYIDASGTIHFTNVPTDPRYKRIDLKPVNLDVLRKRNFQKIETFIDQASQAQQIEPALIKAIIRTESNFDVRAVSSAGAQGLMQLMPATVEELRVMDPFDPKENIRGGTHYLRYLLDRFDQDLRLALAAYHAGPGNVTRHGGVPPFKATVSYLDKVLRFYEIYSDEMAKQNAIYETNDPTGRTLYTNRPEKHRKNLYAQSQDQVILR